MRQGKFKGIGQCERGGLKVVSIDRSRCSTDIFKKMDEP
jgi:hypothetical protein